MKSFIRSKLAPLNSLKRFLAQIQIKDIVQSGYIILDYQYTGFAERSLQQVFPL